MHLNRRTLLAGTALAASAGILPAAPTASATETRSEQLAGAGALRQKIGAVSVTALLDGYLDVSADLILGHDPQIAENLAKAAFQAPGPQRIPVNAFLLETQGKRILIDAGTGDALGPTLGRLDASLALAGYAPDDIDILAITHLHPDHVSGAVGKDGRPLFANAEFVVSETDHRFWQDDGRMNQAPEAVRGFFLGARAATSAYADRLRLVSGGAEVAPGVTARALPGHTPGHTGYLIESGTESLLIWGDAIHVATYQFARPDWGIAFDIDPDEARQTRLRLLDEAASDRIAVTGMHLPFPGFGHVANEGDSYRFVPAEWPYAL
ncbi:MBL fold metallo-hydrolase [Nisaea acidiphila]|uniref:MBL fold metallo-hydrolase n=1 Tax=Nisaea acidiphila TaxID=1862145 RepID=A0A9J7AW21_9PROT|nr:MBL fold metallo-hydrolase [Nisaea acidiphila]UUX50994.1 MBL fold metallo-hydrolase [Nisaea acidiphila]